MVCQCGGTGKGIKSKVGGELENSLQALFTYLCDLCAFECAISLLILLFSTFLKVMENFNDGNFHLWKCKMCVMLSKHGLWKFFLMKV
jgi:hypothetical protein